MNNSIKMLNIEIVEYAVPFKENETEEQAKNRVLQHLRDIEPYRFGYGKIIAREYDSETKKLIKETEL